MTKTMLEAPALYRPSQRAKLMSFLQRAYGSASIFAQESYVRWLYEEGGAALYLQWAGSKVVGQLGSQRCVLSVRGQEVVAHWGVNFIVLPELQRSGIGAALVRARKADTPISLSIDVTPPATRAAKRAGNESVGTVPIFARALTAEAISRRFGGWTRPLGLLAMPGFSALGWMAARKLKRDGLELQQVASFDERADRLWADAKARYPVVSCRDAATLNWRFARYPVPDRYRLFYVLRRGAAVGYVVLRTESRDGLLDGMMVDFFCAPEMVYGVIACAMARLREEGAGAVFCLLCLPGSHAQLLALGFIRRPGSWPLFVRTAGVDTGLEAPLHDLGSWFLTSAESDVDRPR
jgi:hypothetical protein